MEMSLGQRARAAGDRLRDEREKAGLVLRRSRPWVPSGRALVRCRACGALRAWRSGVPPDATELRHREGCAIRNLEEVLLRWEDWPDRPADAG